ncbi:unnamed protein product [Ilex paraguariensis]|uniref:DNA-directed RNA polymerase n=1 Tax=Ilex paraguariensis TaxID=185542 RepID=A0ABC8TZS3_9AQUA
MNGKAGYRATAKVQAESAGKDHDIIRWAFGLLMGRPVASSPAGLTVPTKSLYFLVSIPFKPMDNIRRKEVTEPSMDNELHAEEQVPSGLLTGITFNILSEEDAGKTSAKVIEGVNEVTDPALGLPNPTSQCLTCGAKDVRTCEGHFGLFKFPFTILDPYYISEVALILNKICPGCKSLQHDKVKNADSTSMHRRPMNCKYCDGSLRDLYPTMRFKVSSNDMFAKTAIIAEVREQLPKKFRNKSFGGGVASDYWDIIPHDGQQDESFLKPNKRVLSHAQVYNMLKDVDPRFLERLLKRKNSIFLNCFLVTPNCHRVTELRQHMIFDERTRAYRKLIGFRGTANELSTRVLDCLKISKIHAEKSPAKDSSSKMSGMKFVKELLLGKRSDHAFRMVVVGDPNIKLSEIGVPCHIAERLQISEQLNSYNWHKLNTCCDLRILEKGEVFVRRRGGLVRVRLMDELQIGDTVFRPLHDGDIVLINRPPSIHHHSLIALSVKVLPINSVLSINPLICSPFRGDFDGDCLHGYVPQSMDSRVELHQLLALNRQLINGQSGRNLLSPSHDSLTAAHLVVEDGVLLNLFQMQQLQMFCPHQLQLPAVIKAPSPNNHCKATSCCLWTGKQLFSLLLPPDFNYLFPSNGVRISKGELISSSSGSSWLRDSAGNLFHSLVKHCQGEALGFLHAAQEVLCEWLSMRGLSVSLSDFYLSSDSYSRTNMIDEVSCGLQEAERLSHIRLLMVNYNRDFLIGSFEESQNAVDFGVERMCYEQQKSAALGQASISAFKQVFWDIQYLVYRYASKENSLLAMLKAGSKGNLMKLVQHGMCLGMQHSLVPLSFSIPHQLSCTAWNNYKTPALLHKTQDDPGCAKSHIPCAVIENSFLTGLNPLECFVHSLTSRDSSFSGHADLSGTLTRRLMYFMRDLYIGYDGTVRNAYGNQLVQFYYTIEDTSPPSNGMTGSLNGSAYSTGAVGGHPVGSLAACAISEAAYSALDQPISPLESSPLLNLKKVLECGVKNSRGDKTASLYLSRKLQRWTHGFEYGALEVKNHLERILFSDIVSTVMILFSPQTGSRTRFSPWVCHFDICKDLARRKRIKVQSIIDALYRKCNCSGVKSKINLPDLHIVSKSCSVGHAQKGNDDTICITVAIAESSKNSSRQLDVLRDIVIPYLLGTVVKGFSDFKKVDILWKDQQNVSKSYRSSPGELYLRVFMSESCVRTRFWSVLRYSCLRIMNMIDWERSHPDNIHDLTLAYGIDVARRHFVSSLKTAIYDTGKTILPEHLHLAADCLSATGEFVGLHAKGLAHQRKDFSVSSPFMQACFSSPGDCLIKAAKMGVVDDLQGSVDALSWGKIPSIGTGGRFDIIYSGKGHQLAKPEDIYNLLGSHAGSHEQHIKAEANNELNNMSGKRLAQRLRTYGDFDAKGCKNMISKKILRSFLSLRDIQGLSQALKHMLHKYVDLPFCYGKDKRGTSFKWLGRPSIFIDLGDQVIETLNKVGYWLGLASKSMVHTKNVFMRSDSQWFATMIANLWWLRYAINHELSEVDKSIVMMALYFHPRRSEKIGTGAEEIKVGYHSKYENVRCFLLVRADGTVEDFSYHKCVHHALELIAPQRAKTYQSRWLHEPI